MENVWVETTQQVALQQKIASVGERMLAQLIDFVFVGTYLLIIMLFLSLFGLANTTSSILVSLPAIFYSLILEISMQGQSLGKRILGIKIIKKDGSTPVFFDFFIRWIFRLLDVLIFFGGIGTITIILNGKGQRLGDMVAQTMVIQAGQRQKNILLPPAEHIPVDYQPTFQGVDIFKESEIQTLREVLIFFQADPSESKAVAMIRKASDAVEKKLCVHSGMIPVDLLQTVIKDYYSLYHKDPASLE